MDLQDSVYLKVVGFCVGILALLEGLFASGQCIIVATNLRAFLLVASLLLIFITFVGLYALFKKPKRKR